VNETGVSGRNKCDVRNGIISLVLKVGQWNTPTPSTRSTSNVVTPNLDRIQGQCSAGTLYVSNVHERWGWGLVCAPASCPHMDDSAIEYQEFESKLPAVSAHSGGSGMLCCALNAGAV
jgi:hypothetical protein